jgi:hypothetical protein
VASWGTDPGVFLSGNAPLVAQTNVNTSANIYYSSSLGTGEPILYGTQAEIQQAFGAGSKAADAISLLNLNYSVLSTNSNSVGATLYAAITGQPLPSNSALYVNGLGSSNVLLSQDQLNLIRAEYDLPPIGTQLQNYEQQETLLFRAEVSFPI